MRALILAGGKGTRLKPATHTLCKQLLPVANKPILYYVLDQILEAGIKDIGIIISPETGSQIKEAVGNGKKWGAKVTHILQKEPLGLAHAVQTAREYLGNSSFLMFLGDNLIQGGVAGFVKEFNKTKPDALILLKEVSDPRMFGVAELDDGGKIINITEKPKKPKSNLAIPGVYLFTPAIHRAIEQITPSSRGELEITDSIQKLIDMGKTVKSHILDGWWLDTGKKDDLLEANRVVLDNLLKRKIEGKVCPESRVSGRVEIGGNTEVIESTIRGPVLIAPNCRIINSFIGPFTAIGENTVIENSSVEHSVLLDGCQIKNIGMLSDSIAGRKCQISKSEKKNHSSIRLFLGDDAVIEL